MKLKKVNNSKEILILTGMITNTTFLKKVRSILNTKLFKAKSSKIIAKWCIEYFEEHNTAPNIHIQDVYDDYLSSSKNKENVLIIGKVLQNLSKKFERAENFNTDYILKIAEKHFSSGYMKNRCEQILDVLEEDPKKAYQILKEMKVPQLPSSRGHDIYKSPELMQEALEESRTPLFELPGALGELLNNDLCRESFVAFLGHEKIGKTWLLMELGYHASISRLNTVIIQAGDMGDLQMARRIGIRMCKKSNLERYCGEQLIPIYDCQHNQNGSCRKSIRTGKRSLDIDGDSEQGFLDHVLTKKMKLEFYEDNRRYKACDACRRHYNKMYRFGYAGATWYKKKKKTKPLSVGQAISALKKHDKRTGKGGFKLISYPSDTLTVDEIETQLLTWQDEDLFVPDVIIIDYADIMTTNINAQEERSKQNQIWKGMRSLSQKFKCLVVTASQADANSYGLHTLTMKNFSEDKRKFGHVTSFYSLNKTDAEKSAGILRVATLITRDDEFDTRSQVKVMQNLQTGRACIGSYF